MSRPWIAAGVVVCCLGLGVIIAGWPDRHHDPPLVVATASTTAAPVETTTAPAATSTTPSTTEAARGRAPGDVHVIAFNASTVPGSAGRVSARLKAQGYAVGPAGPDRKPARDTSTVVYRRGFDAEAKAVAADVGLDTGAAEATDGAPGDWGNADVAVMVGNDIARRL